MLQRFNGGVSPEALAKLNALVDELNVLSGLRGDQFIQFVKGPGGAQISMNIQAVVARVPKLAAPDNDVVAVTAATTTDQALTGVSTLDGVTLADGDWVFLQNQTTAADNGVYSFDASTGDLNFVSQSYGVLVTDGTANGQTLWCLSEVDDNAYYEVSGNSNFVVVNAATSNNVSSLAAVATIDGVSLVDGDTVLLTGQTTASQNGVYTVRAVSTPNPTGAWEGPDQSADIVFVAAGSAYEGYWFLLSAANTYINSILETRAIVCSSANIASLVGLPTVDGVTLAAGQTVLLIGQTTASQNGYYAVEATSNTDGGKWMKLGQPGACVIEQGQVLGQTAWALSEANVYLPMRGNLKLYVISVQANYLTCNTKSDGSGTTYYVAKPTRLRSTDTAARAVAGQTYTVTKSAFTTGIASGDAQTCTATRSSDSGTDKLEVVEPYLAGDEITAIPYATGIVDGSSNPINLLDANVDARHWAVKASS